MAFGIRRGSYERLDPKFFAHGGHQKLGNSRVASLGSLVIEEPSYGASVRATAMDGDEVKYIRVTDFDDFGVPTGHKFVTAERVDDKYLLSDGDILFARSGTVGKTFIYSHVIGPAIYAGYCIRFRFDTSKVIPKFVYYYTKTERYKAWVMSVQRPSVQSNINKEEFKSFTIPLPPLGKQKSLVRLLDNSHESRQYNIAIADALLSGVDSWIMKELGIAAYKEKTRTAYAVQIGQSSSSKQLGADYYHPERVNALRSIKKARKVKKVKRLEEIVDFIRDIKKEAGPEQYIGLASIESNTGELVANIVEPGKGQCLIFQNGDVLYGRLRPYLNKVWSADKDGVCSTEFHVLRIKSSVSLVHSDYLAAALRSSLIVAQTKHMMTGNTHPRLANDDVGDLLVPIPDEITQMKIVTEIQRCRNEARCLRRDAEEEWEASKVRFEAELLGNDG